MLTDIVTESLVLVSWLMIHIVTPCAMMVWMCVWQVVLLDGHLKLDNMFCLESNFKNWFIFGGHGRVAQMHWS